MVDGFLRHFWVSALTQIQQKKTPKVSIRRWVCERKCYWNGVGTTIILISAVPLLQPDDLRYEIKQVYWMKCKLLSPNNTFSPSPLSHFCQRESLSFWDLWPFTRPQRTKSAMFICLFQVKSSLFTYTKRLGANGESVSRSQHSVFLAAVRELFICSWLEYQWVSRTAVWMGNRPKDFCES
jgi:hypothetical protein